MNTKTIKMKNTTEIKTKSTKKQETKPDGYTLLGEVKGCGTFHRTMTTTRPDQPNGVCWFCNQP